MEEVNVRSIVEDFLRKSGADGLYNALHECGCPIDGLMECEFFCTYCKPAIGVECPECGNKIMLPGRYVKGMTAWSGIGD